MRQWLVVAALPLLFGCKTPAPSSPPGAVSVPPSEERSDSHASQVEASSVVRSNPAPYLRVARPSSNITELQVAVRQFLPLERSRPIVWLAGVSHVGESNYYARLQKMLDGQDLVLFEGVTDEASRAAGRRTFGRSEDELGSLQTTMAESLGLAFQLNSINYERPHFRNSDLTIEQLAQLIAKEGPADGAPSKTLGEFEKLMELMEGNSLIGALVGAGMKLIGTSPKLQALMKLAMIEMLGRFKGDLSQFQGLPPEWQRLIEVLVRARNEAVIKDLRAEFGKRSPAKSITIFYGAAHMEDFERRMTEMHYRPGRELWLSAFSVDLDKAQVTASELSFVQSLVDWQMKMLQQGE